MNKPEPQAGSDVSLPASTKSWVVPSLWIAGGLALVLAYANFFSNSFHFDDMSVIVSNIYIRSLSNIPHFFTDARTYSTIPTNTTYRPVVSLSLAIDHFLAGGVSNVFFHVTQFLWLLVLWVALAVVYRRLLDLGRRDPVNRVLAILGATLFCIHTVNTETMNVISVRSEMLSAIGLLTGLLIYLSSSSPKRAALALVPVAIGALAKPTAVVYAPLLLVLAWLFMQGEGQESLLRRAWGALRTAALPILACAAVYLFTTAMNAPQQTYGGSDRFHYALTQTWAWVHYLDLFVRPIGLTADSDWAPITQWSDRRVFAGVFAIGGLLLLAWVCARRRTTAPAAFGILWFMVCLLPTSSVLPLAEVINEHRVFLPYMGLVLAVVVALQVAGRSVLEQRWGLSGATAQRIVLGLLSVAIVAHAFGTHARNKVWLTPETMWQDVTQKSPQNGRGWMNYGLALMGRGEYAGAKSAFERARDLAPRYSIVEVNLGILNAAMNNSTEAETHFGRALSLGPDEPDAHFFYAKWLVNKGRGPEAVRHLKRTIDLSPANLMARSSLLDLYNVVGDETELVTLARDTIRLQTDHLRAREYLQQLSGDSKKGGSDCAAAYQKGLRLTQQQQLLEAAIAYHATVRCAPDHADALNNLGWCLGKLGFAQEAERILESALKVRPDYALARNNLTWVRSLKKH